MLGVTRLTLSDARAGRRSGTYKKRNTDRTTARIQRRQLGCPALAYD